MQEFLQRDLDYVIRVNEILWGGVLLALTIAIHGVGMLQTLRTVTALMSGTRGVRARHPAASLAILVLAAWMIILFHLIEVMVWAGFFVWKDAQPSLSSASYHAMLNYCTLQAGYLPQRWRLLEGALGMSGLITFAWSTSILFSVAQNLMQQVLQRQHKPTPGPDDPAGA
jgi:hypothetical protein